MARVSIVIPAYNVELYLSQTLKFALASDYEDFEIIVVNDGSHDRTEEVARSFGGKVRVIAQANGGMSAARNKGISSTDSEFIALLDADDLWHPQKLGLQVHLLQQRPEIGLVFGEFRLWDGIADPVFPKQRIGCELVPELGGWIYHKFVLTNWALPSTLLFRRSVVDEIGLFSTDDSKTDDWEYMVRASRHCQFEKLKDIVVLYRQHPSQLSRKLSPVDVTYEMRERMIQKYGTSGPDGKLVDQSALAARRFASQIAFGGAHVERGDFGLGVSKMMNLLLFSSNRFNALEVLGKSTIKRIVGKIR